MIQNSSNSLIKMMKDLLKLSQNNDFKKFTSLAALALSGQIGMLE